jgi:type IV pilus assembly protein PilM
MAPALRNSSVDARPLRFELSLRRSPKPVVGLDIGSSAVKAIELKPNGSKGFKVVAYASESIPPDTIVDGAVIDAVTVADAIRRIFDTKRFKAKDVVASLSGNAVIVKKIALPVMTDAELADSIHWEAEQYIPFDIQDVHLDYQVLDRATGESGRQTMDVLLVAAKKDKIADYTGVISQAGRNAVIVDVDAFAVQNCYEANYGVPAGVTVLLNAGASAINVNIVRDDHSLFTRDISIGGNAYTEAVQKEFSLAFEAAEHAKQGVVPDGVAVDELRAVLRTVSDSVLLEIEKTFDFFKATTSDEHIDRIVVCGGASRVDGFADLLAERFGASVGRLDPFKAVELDASRLGGALPDDVASTAAVAVGLALRRAGDR